MEPRLPGLGPTPKPKRPKREPTESDLAGYAILDAAWDLVRLVPEVAMTRTMWRTRNKASAVDLHRAGKTPDDVRAMLDFAHNGPLAGRYYHGLVRLDRLQEAWPQLAQLRRESEERDAQERTRLADHADNLLAEYAEGIARYEAAIAREKAPRERRMASNVARVGDGPGASTASHESEGSVNDDESVTAQYAAWYLRRFDPGDRGSIFHPKQLRAMYELSVSRSFDAAEEQLALQAMRDFGERQQQP